MKGRIVKGIAGFYYVNTESKVYECKAKGLFRNNNIKPLVGDFVEIDIIDEEKALGHITKILPRKNTLIRPAVSNVDIIAVVQSTASPKPRPYLMDKYFINMQKYDIDFILIWTKSDIITDEAKEYIEIYNNIGIKSFIISEKDSYINEYDLLIDFLRGKTTALAGVSGVGKSSLINRMCERERMEVGSLSKKIERGKHTTRHSEIFCVDKDTYIYVTPGFSSIEISDMYEEDLEDYYHEIAELSGNCKFNKCSHITEPNCKIKDALNCGKISKIRYDNYTKIYQELKAKRRH